MLLYIINNRASERAIKSSINEIRLVGNVKKNKIK